MVKFMTRRFKGGEPYQPYVPRCQAEVMDEATGAIRQCKRDAKFASPPSYVGESLWCRQHAEFDRFKQARAIGETIEEAEEAQEKDGIEYADE